MTVLANGNKLSLFLTVLIDVVVLKGELRMPIQVLDVVYVCRPPIFTLRLVDLAFALVPLEDFTSLPAPLRCVVERIVFLHMRRSPLVGI